MKLILYSNLIYNNNYNNYNIIFRSIRKTNIIIKKLKNFEYFTLIVHRRIVIFRVLLINFAGDFIWSMWKGIVKS